jgi:nicotinate dehydrogenase subunit B
MSQARVTRREFIEGAAALVVYASAPRLHAAENAASLPRDLARNPSLATWLRIDAGGTVSLFTGKCELGQGIRTALAQVAAEELDVDVSRIRILTVDTASSPNEGRTVGSNSMHQGGDALRAASAEARDLLLRNAARRLGTGPEQLSVEDGTVRAAGSGASVTYWDLLADGKFNATASGEAKPKAPARHRVVGKPVHRLDLPGKIYGEPSFIQDRRMPGMLHARIVRPAMHSGRLLEVDTGTASKLPGVVQVVRDGSFLAVVATREEQAITAADALAKSARWASAEPLPKPSDFPHLLRELKADVAVIHEQGAGTANASRRMEASYSRPYIAHASMSPSAAVALWDGSLLTVWSHAQGMYPLRAALASVLGLPESKIRCVHEMGAGCYGHNGADDAACDAAMIAMAVRGRPVRLQWSRYDEFRYEPYGSAMSMRVSAGIDADGRIVEWQHDVWSCTHSSRPGGNSAGNMLAAREKTEPLPEPPPSNMSQPAGGGDRNAVPLYTFENQRIVKHFVRERPLRVSALRSLGAFGNVFAIESFMDEIARELGADPFELRLAHLDDPRAREVLDAVRAMAANRDPAEGGGKLSGRGLAFARYKNMASYLAIVADVTVDPDSGRVRVERAYAAIDGGQLVNPDGVRNQVEGGIVQATSWTLKEAVRYSPEGIQSIDWAHYPILRFNEVPEIEVSVLDRPELPLLGVGEASQGPTAAAVANAVTDATGVRLRDLPLTPERITAALEEAGSEHRRRA